MRVLRDYRGFTLTELLVVIAILVVVISLLFPGMSNLHQRMFIVQCAGNQRQLGTAMGMYLGEYGEKIIPDCTRKLTGELIKRNEGNDVVHAINTDHPQIELIYGWGHIMQAELIEPGKLFFCPSVEDNVIRNGTSFERDNGVISSIMRQNDPEKWWDNPHPGLSISSMSWRTAGYAYRAHAGITQLSESNTIDWRIDQGYESIGVCAESQSGGTTMTKSGFGYTWPYVHRAGYNVVYLGGEVRFFADEARVLGGANAWFGNFRMATSWQAYDDLQ